MNIAQRRELKLFFREDARRIQESLKAFAASWAAGDRDEGAASRSFRDTHSLKSEAAFLEYAAITEKAGEIEKVFVRLRGGGMTDEDLPRKIEELCAELDVTLDAISAELGEPGAAAAAEAGETEFASLDFEMAMIQEAHYRGEKFYRIEAAVAQDEPMPFPRLYLLVNNLELCANLVRITPPLDVLKQDKDFSVALYATTSRDTAELEEALDVDGITSLDIAEIPFGHIGLAREEEPVSVAGEPRAAALRYSRGERKNVFFYRDELALYAFLSAALAARPRLDAQSRLLAKALTASLGRRSGVPLARVLEKAAEVANRTATQLGKMLQTEVLAGEDIMVPASARDALNTVLTHLVRNAVDHGIESPDERASLGKLKWGRLLLEAEIKDGLYTVRIADDGAGIRAETIRRASEQKDAQVSGSILDILTQPGFSTRIDATQVSGRGVGLDVVRGLVTGCLGGRLGLETKPGKGTVFTISFSGKTLRYAAFPAQVGGRLLLAPRVMAESIFPLKPENLSGTRNILYSLQGFLYPVRLFAGQTEASGQGILIRGTGEPFIIAASSVEEEKMYSLGELVPSVCVLLSQGF
ncbi:MAG: ATP-binding protein [Spirochaetaceae bacterium]|nr:ATP-binding protein [Spirochaetaceae bacterium]